MGSAGTCFAGPGYTDVIDIPEILTFISVTKIFARMRAYHVEGVSISVQSPTCPRFKGELAD